MFLVNCTWKCLVVLFGLYYLTSATPLFRCYDADGYTEVPVNSPDPLVTSGGTYVDITKPTYFLCQGFDLNPDGILPSTLVPTLLSHGDKNVCLVNWKDEAAAGILGDALGYTLNALPNSKKVGIAVGKAIVKLVGLGLRNDIHFVGHSLGAHLGGYCGKETIKSGIYMEELIALDPARLGYTSSLIYTPVDKTCAKFVWGVHCDVGGYALNKSAGHVDFWPNYDKYVSSTSTRLQPGCTQGTSMQEILSNGNRCSHDRCWQFLNVALNNPSYFEGGKADNYYNWVSENGTFVETNFIGPLIDQENTGNFYMVTGAESPWGLGVEGLYPPTSN